MMLCSLLASSVDLEGELTLLIQGGKESPQCSFGLGLFFCFSGWCFWGNVARQELQSDNHSLSRI